MARVNDFIDWATILLFVFVIAWVYRLFIPCICRLLAKYEEYCTFVLIAFIIYILFDLLVLTPMRDRDARDNREKQFKELKNYGRFS